MSIAEFEHILASLGSGHRTAILAGGGERSFRHIAPILTESGCKIHRANTDEETFQLVRELQPDLVILDPDLDGELLAAEVCRVIKSDPLLQATQIIMRTEHNAREEVTASILAGADGCISFELTADDIKTRILPALRNRANYTQLQSANERFQRIFLELRALNNEKQRELREGSIFQNSLLPPTQDLQRIFDALSIDVSIFHSPYPGAEVSGDFWDVYPFHDRSIGLLLADAVGHGIRAAFYSMYTLSALRRSIEPGSNAFLAQYSKELFGIMNGTHLAAMYCRCAEDSLFFTNAGMPAPLLRHGNEVEALEIYGPVLGGFETPFPYSETKIDLRPGSSLILVSDGIIEAKNGAGEEFGTERLQAAAAASGEDAEAMNITIIGRLLTFLGDESLSDDASMVILRRRSL